MEIESSLIVKVCGSLNFSGLFPFPRVGRGRETLARAPLGAKGKRRLKFRLERGRSSKKGISEGNVVVNSLLSLGQPH